MWIYRPYITDKNGNKRYAKWYGKKVFRFWVDELREETDKINEEKVKKR